MFRPDLDPDKFLKPDPYPTKTPGSEALPKTIRPMMYTNLREDVGGPEFGRLEASEIFGTH